MYLVIFLTYVLFHSGFCAKILGIFADYGYSQYILSSSLMKELAKNGHQVTMVSTFRQKTSLDNFTEIYVDGIQDIIRKSESSNLYDLEAASVFHGIRTVYQLNVMLEEHILNHKHVRELTKSSNRFDLVIVGETQAEALFAYSWLFEAPLVSLNALGPGEWINDRAANPTFFSYVPHTFSEHTTHMDFWQRTKNCFYHTVDLLDKHFYRLPKQKELLERHFPGAPPLEDLMYNVSLVLLNSHASITESVPLAPNMVEIGGFHISPEPLPDDLRRFLDDAEEGVIYFSMGSNLRSKDLDEELKNVFVNVFSKMKLKVLWKWDEDLEGPYSNIKTGAWLPQLDILLHPNVRVFVTHGGLLSTMEAVYAGKPLLGIPIFLDQKLNIARAVSRGFARLLPLREIDEITFEQALHELLNNSSYTEKAEELRTIFRDQKITPMERAVFSIDHILKYKGAHYLRPLAAINLKWYQYFSLDVVSFLSFILVSVYIVVSYILSKIIDFHFDTFVHINNLRKKTE